MIFYRVTIELCSPLVTPLKGDTIWGHIVWGIANHEGDGAVAEFLEQEKNLPVLVVSSAFPAGMLCRPLPEPEEREEKLSSERYSQIKKDKKKIYVPASEYFAGIDPAEAAGGTAFKTETVRVTRNKIDRETNTVFEGGLYTSGERWAGTVDGNGASDWDLYILSSLEKARISRLVGWAFENGYGADSSTGKGKIVVKGEPCPVSPKKGGTGYMALGPFVLPDESGVSNLRADIFVRSGKIGGSFASVLSPYKKPVVLFDEGAVFSAAQPLEYAGMLLTDMHGEDKRICQSGFAPVIPVG
ncbi:MAG: CRISPR-associated protein Csm4 [Treponema sp.]|jgi:CRISPR-associated protein Csm4|nr:CRISPR-associated protein Csm4 [Treponema sp.]